MFGDLFVDDPADEFEVRETEEEILQRELYVKLQKLKDEVTPFWRRLMDQELLLKPSEVNISKLILLLPGLQDIYRITKQDQPELTDFLENMETLNFEKSLFEMRASLERLHSMQQPLGQLVVEIMALASDHPDIADKKAKLEGLIQERDTALQALVQNIPSITDKSTQVLAKLTQRKTQLDKWVENSMPVLKAFSLEGDDVGASSSIVAAENSYLHFVFGSETPGKVEAQESTIAPSDPEKRIAECLLKFCQEYMKGVDSFLASPQFDAVVERVSLLSSYTKHFRFKKSGRKKTQKVLIPKIPKLVEELEELMSPFEDVGAPLKKVAEMISSVYSIDGLLVSGVEKRRVFCESVADEVHRNEQTLESWRNKHARRGEVLRACQVEEGKVVQRKSSVLNIKLELDRLHLFGAPPLTVEHMEVRYSNAQKAVQKQEAVALEARKTLDELREMFPEVDLAVSMAPIQRRRLYFTGKEMNRSRSDYVEISTLSERVKHCRCHGSDVILKEYKMIEDETIYRTVVSAVHGLEHSGVVKLTGYFFEDNKVYLEFPYHSGGTLAQWLTRGRDEMEKRSIFFLILQGLYYLHDQGVVHANLSLDSVVLDASGRPVLVDFDHCVSSKSCHVPLRRECHRVATATGREEFVAPEVLEGAEPTPSSDMWSFGVMMYKAQAGLNKAVVTIGGKIKDFRLGSSFQDEDSWLVVALLSVDPSQRMSAYEALCHPYFTQPTVDYLRSKGQLLDPETKVRAARTHLSVTRQRNEPIFGIESVTLGITSSRIFDSVMDNFCELLEDGWRMPLELHYDGDSDFPRNLTRIYNKFFTSLHTGNAFESNTPGQQLVLPVPNASNDRMQLIGKTLVKVVLDGRLVPHKAFAPSLYKYLCGNPVTFEDLEVFHPAKAADLRRLLTEPNAEAWNLNFGSAGGNSSTIVNDQNKHSYVEELVQWVLVGSRRSSLEAIRRGFHWCMNLVEMENTLMLLSWSEMRAFLCGNFNASASEIAAEFDFPQTAVGQKAKAFLEETLLYWETNRRRGNLRKLIQFLTGLPALPVGHMYNPTVAAMMPEKLQVRMVEGDSSGLQGQWNTCECTLGCDSPMMSTAEVFRTTLEATLQDFETQQSIPQDVREEEDGGLF